MEPINIDKKLENELLITKPLREIQFQEEIDEEINKAWNASKYNGRARSKIFMDKLKADLIKTNYDSAPKLKELLDTIEKIENDSAYLKFPFSKQIEDFALAHVRLLYNDGKTVEPLSKHYNGIIRTNMKSVSVISESEKILFTLDIINDKLLYRTRNILPPITEQEKLDKLSHSNYERMDWNNPKRCFILSTEGRTVFVWDSGEIVETTNWSEVRPYNKPNLREEENF
jgi:hypothetical protein